MGKLLTALNISEDVQKTLPQNVILAEKILMGFQKIYSESPESPRKEILADAISTGVFQMLEEIKNPATTLMPPTILTPTAKWYVGKSIKELDKIIIDMRRAVANVFPKGTPEGDEIIKVATEIMNYIQTI
jgi:hypothetical protein